MTAPNVPDRDTLARIARQAYRYDQPTMSIHGAWLNVIDAVLAHLATTRPPTETGLRERTSSTYPARQYLLLAAVRATVGDLKMRLDRIAGEHHKNVDERGGTYGDCNECGWGWPCPTYRWATAPTVDVNCTWDLSECGFDHDHDAALDGGAQ